MLFSLQPSVQFTDTSALPCAWPRPAVLGFRIGKYQLPLGSPCSFNTPHARLPGHRGRLCPRLLILQVLSPISILSFCKPWKPTVRDNFRLLLAGPSPRGHHLFSLHVWPVQRWCLSIGTNAGPSLRWDQAGNSRDISNRSPDNMCTR